MNEEKHIQMVVLGTAPFEEKCNNAELSKDTSGTSRVKKEDKYGTGKNTTPTDSGVPKLKFAYEGNKVEVYGVDYEWCEHHGHKDKDGKQSNMYMYAPHDHTKRAKHKAKRISKGKEKGENEEPKVTPKPPIQPLSRDQPQQI